MKQLPDNMWAPLQGTLRQPAVPTTMDAFAIALSVAAAIGITILNWA